MSPRRNSELDSLIADITVDCYNDDEQLTAFEAAFDNDATLPCPGRAIGEEVSVISIDMANGRRELMASCEHNGPSLPNGSPRHRTQRGPENQDTRRRLPALEQQLTARLEPQLVYSVGARLAG